MIGSDSLPLKNYWQPTRFKAFFRRAKSKNQAVVEAEDGFVAAEVEDAMPSMRNEATNQTQLIHPVSFDDYNVILLLEEGCASLQCPFSETFVAILISSKPQHLPRRKAPYGEILEKYVRACSCSGTLLGGHLSFVVYLVKKYCLPALLILSNIWWCFLISPPTKPTPFI